MSKFRLWLLVIILIAFTIRLYNLTYHSLWFDEAISVFWARQSLARIVEVGFTLVEDRLPPLYYLTLKGWTALAGFSETSVRLPSVFYGVLLAPVVASIGTLLFNRRVALMAALLVAANPFLVWYAQEARMYAPAVFWGAVAVWSLLQFVNARPRAIQPASTAGRRGPLPFYTALLFILSATAALYSHLYAGFLLPALGLWLVIGYPRRWRLWLLFAGGGLVVTAAFAPLALAIWRFSGEAAPADAPLASLGQHLWWLLRAFTTWKAPLSPVLKAIIPITVALFVLAAYLRIPAFRSHRAHLRYPLLLMTLLLLFPFLIAALLLYRNHLAFFGERYFIVMLPWLLLLASVGADKLGQWLTGYVPQNLSTSLRYLPFIILFFLTGLALPGQWSVPAAKEAWRQSVAYLAGQTSPDHGILIHPDWVRHPFQFYFQGPGQTYAAFSEVTPQTALDGPLEGVVDNHPVIWLIQSHLDGTDPDRLVEQWFGARYPLVTELYPPGISLKGYAPGYRLATLPPEARPVDIEFENGLKLAGFRTDESVAATDLLFHPPSGWVHVTLYWTGSRPVAGESRPFVQLVGSEGVWGASLDRSNDALALWPPSRWSPDVIIRHDLDVNLNPATPPGRYHLMLGVEGEEKLYLLDEVLVE